MEEGHTEDVWSEVHHGAVEGGDADQYDGESPAEWFF